MDQNENFRKFTGKEIRAENIKECIEVAELIKTSLGPISFDKMIVDEVGDITITNDGANILKRLDIGHPAAKILVNLSGQQEEEVGDGTTSVVLIASELLQRAELLMKKKIHPSVIISAFRLGMCHSCSFIREKLTLSSQTMNLNRLLNAAKTSLSSKISGINAKKFSTIALQAVKSVQVFEKNKEKFRCQIKAINFVKIMGNSLNKSRLIDGYIFQNQKVSPMMGNVSPTRIAFINFDLRRSRLPIGFKIENKKSTEIEKIFKKEINSVKGQIRKIFESGANLIITTRGIEEEFIKYFLKNGIGAIKRVSFEDLKRIAMATGGKIQNSFSEMTFKKGFDGLWLGEAEEAFSQEISFSEIFIVRGCRFSPAGTIFLRGGTEYLLEELSQSLFDAIFIIKRAIEGNKLVSGGGAVETALCTSIQSLSNSILSREQLPLLEFGEALMIIPKILIKNAGLDNMDILSKLRILHEASSEKKFSDYRFFGLDLSKQKIQNNLYRGIVEPAINKIKSIQIATEAAITILRIDDFINLKKKK
ncbi:tcpA (nucleomorph) [Hemiselmis andersenii]|uniref:TcpA n=1 Tax=Hemiselmis andersenii TaxID=464988 RepID=A9BKQ7_HEMAN|nr:tcpA [Hemiselmis andersenii]ABW98062.1 tcpA [Hemiselmis andersenii]|mmetsp:Transcript_23224/g.53930  ORF Transcript_23224/g.53930 Transcript_23224/m.53930 type:complete len:535 (+) Transcript_23224:24-1628(+)